MSQDRYRIEPLGQQHDRTAFSCGNDSLDAYFRRQAGQDIRRRIAAVFVLVDTDVDRVAGYYTLSACAIAPIDLPEDMVRRLPRYREFPATLIGRLATSIDYQGQGFGRRLLVDALQRSAEQSKHIASMAVVVDAIDDAAVGFYARYGFKPIVSAVTKLYLPMQSIRLLTD